MKKLFIITLTLALAGCAAPKYSYRFAPSRYLAAMANSGQAEHTQPVANEKQVLVAATEVPAWVIAPPADSRPAGPKFKRAVRKLRDKVNEIGEKVVVKTGILTPPAPASVDDDLKYSIILAAAGIVSLLLLVLSKIFGIIGGIALIAATVFFAKWVLQQ